MTNILKQKKEQVIFILFSKLLAAKKKGKLHRLNRSLQIVFLKKKKKNLVNKASQQTTFYLKEKQAKHFICLKILINLKFYCALKMSTNHGTHRNIFYGINITTCVNRSFLIMVRKL